MEQRDLIKDQIEQLGRVLGKIIADFLGIKSTGNIENQIAITNQQLKNELDIDVDEIIRLDKMELRKYAEKRKLTAEHLEALSEYLREIGESKIDNNKQDATRNLEKAIELLKVADEISSTMSLDRINKKLKIENVLQQ